MRTGIYIYTHVYWLATKYLQVKLSFIKMLFPYIQLLISSFMTINFYSLVDLQQWRFTAKKILNISLNVELYICKLDPVSCPIHRLLKVLNQQQLGRGCDHCAICCMLHVKITKSICFFCKCCFCLINHLYQTILITWFTMLLKKWVS